jgi:predicted glycosyltransferase
MKEADADEEAAVTAGLDAAVMFYSHDSYGLGHLRRTLALARHLRADSQLIVTGSPLAHRFQFPPGTDYIKLPSVLKRGEERYEPRYLRVPFSDVSDLRRDLLLCSARHLRPDVLIVDNVPRGLKGELLPTLAYLKEQSCRLVLGLRDVVDEAEWVKRTWRDDGSYELLDDVYDLILVYGRRDVYDVVEEYDFSPEAAAKTRFVGYLRRDLPTRCAASSSSAPTRSFS